MLNAREIKTFYIELIDFDEPEKNVFKIVNQFEIEGINNQLRIPDGIVFINGIPVVVLEFKSAVKENTTIMDAYTRRNGKSAERLRDEPPERYHDITWDSLPIKNRTSSLDELRKFYEGLPSAKE